MHANTRLLRSVPVILAAALVLLSVSAGTAPGPQLQKAIHRGHEVVAGEVLVKFRGARSAAPSADEIQWLADTDRDEEIGRLGVRRVRSRSLNVDRLLAALAARPDVEYAEPNYIVYAIDTVPIDTHFGILWGLRNTGQKIGGKTGVSGADIEATAAWDITTGSRANVVAVIDTGIDYNHQDLQANVWSAPAAFSVTIGSRTITCGAGTHGFNAITLTCDPMDDNSHGTHVSGTIGATGNNDRGVVGVNWIGSVMGAKFLDANGDGTIADAINAIEFAIQAKQVFGAGANVRVLSNSWGGGGFSQSLLNEINKANASDMLFVAAAGNAGSNNDAVASYPSNYNAPNVVAVAATDNTDQLASFSNYGVATVELGAPGFYIVSTVRNNGYAYYSGTSMAAPHVSGAAALILSACSLGTDSLRTTILSTGDQVSALAGKTITGGRLNVLNALNGCVAEPAAPSGLSATVVGSQVNLTWADNSSNEFGFRIERATSGGAWGAIGIVAAKVTSYTDATIAPSTQYSYRVFAYNAAGDSVASSNTVSTTQALAITGFSPDHASPYPASGYWPITWTATATGGTAVQYRFEAVKSPNTLYSVLPGCDWSTSNTCVWTPAMADVGTWSIRVFARNGATGAQVGPVTVAYTVTTYLRAMSLDGPSGTVTATTTVAGGGWAFRCGGTITLLELLADGVAQAAVTFTTGGSRPDVAAAYQSVCPSIGPTTGFSFVWDATAIPDGTHQLRIRMTDDVGVTTLSNIQATSIVRSGAQAATLLSLDLPSGAVTGAVPGMGWAFRCGGTITAYDLTIDGVSQPTVAVSSGIVRPDVQSAFSSSCPTISSTTGFSFSLDTTALAPGSHTLRIFVTDDLGVVTGSNVRTITK